MPTPPLDAYQRFQPWRRTFESAFWMVLILTNAIANTTTVLIDARRAGWDVADWEPVVWEWSSGLVMLALVPAMAWLTRRFPLHWETWRRLLPWYVLASVAFSLLHVLGMVALRILAYQTQGESYDFGPWRQELVYEYLKDVRTFALVVATIQTYRWVLRRIQGEASVLAAPDGSPALEPVDRPERFLVRKLGREFLIAAADIEWLRASENYVNLRVSEHDYPLRSTIGGIESKLDPSRFARVHRSFIVNLDQIVSIEPFESGDARLHLKDGTVLPCSRRYRGVLRGRVGAEP